MNEVSMELRKYGQLMGMCNDSCSGVHLRKSDEGLVMKRRDVSEFEKVQWAAFSFVYSMIQKGKEHYQQLTALIICKIDDIFNSRHPEGKLFWEVVI